MSDKPRGDRIGMDGLSAKHITVELQKALGVSHIATALASQASAKPVAASALPPTAPKKE